jgi:6-pyruvoyltetrahydropterin/6-carboxytetrahydropterin synthase
MYKITKRFDFCASHQLTGLPEGHQCGRLHGHNYSVTVHLFGELDKVGFIRDYGELSVVKNFIDTNVEHRHLNDVVDFNPTAENLAKWFYDVLKPFIPELNSVAVKETDKTQAMYVDESAIAEKTASLKALVDTMERIMGRV